MTDLVERANGHGEVDFTAEQMDLIKRTVLRPSKRQATDDELALLAYQARRTGLDPLARQIYGIYRWNKRANAEVMTIQTSIDGFRLTAQRSGRYMGQTETLWADAEGRWYDVWLKSEPPAAAKVGVYIEGAPNPTFAVARTASYIDGRSPMWRSMPEVMIAKCAEALALRKAFPAELSGLYTSEEMAQADRPEQPSQLRQQVPERQIEPPPSEPAPVETSEPAEDAVETIDPERAAKIATGFKALGLNIGQVAGMFGAAGLDGIRARSKKAIEERLEQLTEPEADALEAEMGRVADRGE